MDLILPALTNASRVLAARVDTHRNMPSQMMAPGCFCMQSITTTASSRGATRPAGYSCLIICYKEGGRGGGMSTRTAASSWGATNPASNRWGFSEVLMERMMEMISKWWQACTGANRQNRILFGTLYGLDGHHPRWQKPESGGD